MPLFAFPLALAAAAAIPTLAAIYWLHNRFQRRVVSSLMFWAEETPARAGGLRWQKIHTPLLFFLELLALAMLIIGAMGPRIVAPGRMPPLVVVLDDSFSMLAGKSPSDSARAIAVDALARELTNEEERNTMLLLAGAKPQILGKINDRGATLTSLLSGWKCLSPVADIDRAIAFAGELTGGKCRVLVITDHAAPPIANQGRVQWRAFGSNLPNLAIVNVARAKEAGADRMLVEVANFSPDPRRAELSIKIAVKDSHQLLNQTLNLAPRETRRIVVQLPPDAGEVRAGLPADALLIDNEAVLLPTARRQVRVQTSISEASLAQLVKQAVDAVPEAVAADGNAPHLFISDKAPASNIDLQTWQTQILVDADAQAYVGPFVIDYSHPLTKGLALDTIVWGAGEELKLSGAPVIAAGNLPLITDDVRMNGRHDLRIRLAPKLSTLQATPNWPILIWNLVNWRAAELPGLSSANLRVGENMLVQVAPNLKKISVRDPLSADRAWDVAAQRVIIPVEKPGVFEVNLGEGAPVRFAANLMSDVESDLSTTASGQTGSWVNEASLWWEHRGIAWIFLLVAITCICMHGFLIARSGRASV